METAKIRPYAERDAEDVRAICDANDNTFSAAQRDILLTLYCNYYIEQEPQHALILADGNDRAVGYCIAASDWTKYKTFFNERYMPELRRSGGLIRTWVKKAEMRYFDRFAASYPAHLHIDLQQGWRGGGNGTKLLSAMVELLKKEGASGVMLGVGANNSGARRFYKRFGFSEIGRFGGCVVCGYRMHR